MDLPESILAGVVSGTLTSLLLLIAGTVLYKGIIPWYQNKIFKGLDLNGIWQQKIEQSKTDNEVYKLSLHQRGHNLSGEFSIFQDHHDSEPVEVKLLINGETLNGMVLLSMKAADQKVQGLATLLAKCTGNGTTLNGKLSFLNAYEEKIHAIQLNLVRKL